MLNIKPLVKGGTLLTDVMIESITRVGVSNMGNPRYLLHTDIGNFTMMSDAAGTYGVSNHVGRHRVCLELTRAGRVRYVTPMSALESFYGPAGQ